MQASTVSLFVDHYKVQEAAQGHGRKVDSAQTATALTQSIKILGPVGERIAIIQEQDHEGVNAFQRAHFQVRSMNGERDQTIHEFIQSLRDHLQFNHPKYLVAVTNDPVFHYLFQNVPTYDTELRVLVPGSDIPPVFRQANYDVRLLSDIIPEPKPTRYDIRIDYENVHIGLERNGYAVSPKELIQAIMTKAAEFGDVRGNVVAYADWDLLSRNSRHNPQRQLSLIQGVDTVYQANEKGKNSADMRIASDIHKSVESDVPDGPDVIILCTGDRDFRPVVDTAKSRDKRVILFAVNDTLSNELQEAVDEVYYLDDLFSKSPEPTLMKRPKPNHPQAKVAIKFLNFLQRKRWAYAYAGRVDEAFGSNAEAQLREAVAAQVLTEQDGKFSPNYQHPLVQACQHLLKWVVWRIKAVKEQRGFTQVDASFLFKEMRRDRKLQDWQIGKDWDEAAAWLDLMATTGLIQQGSRPNPHEPDRTITTWLLAGKTTPTPTENTDDSADTPDETAPEPADTSDQPDTTNDTSDTTDGSITTQVPKENIQRQLDIHYRRLQILKEQAARDGRKTDPSVLIEIEELTHKIEKLESQS